MNEIVSWLITSLVILLLVAALVYLIGLLRLPTAQLPRIAHYDRFGQRKGFSDTTEYSIMTGIDDEERPDDKTDKL